MENGMVVSELQSELYAFAQRFGMFADNHNKNRMCTNTNRHQHLLKFHSSKFHSIFEKGKHRFHVQCVAFNQTHMSI